MCVPLACFETGFRFVSGSDKGQSRNLSEKSKAIEGKDICSLDYNNYTSRAIPLQCHMSVDSRANGKSTKAAPRPPVRIGRQLQKLSSQGQKQKC